MLQCLGVSVNPDWEHLHSQLENYPKGMTVPKQVVASVLEVLQENWERLQSQNQFWSPEGILHLRKGDLPGLSKTVEISKTGFYILNKGNVPKVAIGLMKEVSRGVDLTRLQRIVHATVRIELKEKYCLSAVEVKKMTDQEIKIHALFKGDERVVQIYDLCSYRSKEKQLPSVEKLGIVMEDCNLGDLLMVAEDQIHGYFDQKENVLAIVIDMVLILASLYRAKVIHRDLKFENLFVIESNGTLRLKLGDFGLSGLILEEKERLKRQSETVGGEPRTYSLPIYLSSNQQLIDADESFREENSHIIDILCSHEMDVWAMGINLYDFLMGDVPKFREDMKLTQEAVDAYMDEKLVPDNVVFECLVEETDVLDRLFRLIRQMLKVEIAEIPSGPELVNFLQKSALL